MHGALVRAIDADHLGLHLQIGHVVLDLSNVHGGHVRREARVPLQHIGLGLEALEVAPSCLKRQLDGGVGTVFDLCGLEGQEPFQ